MRGYDQQETQIEVSTTDRLPEAALHLAHEIDEFLIQCCFDSVVLQIDPEP